MQISDKGKYCLVGNVFLMMFAKQISAFAAVYVFVTTHLLPSHYLYASNVVWILCE